MRLRTSASISPLDTLTSNAGVEQAGNRRTHSGLSHSCERPTRESPAPRAQTISVPLARSDTTRMIFGSGRDVRFFFQRGQSAFEEGESAKQQRRKRQIADQAVTKEWNRGHIAGREASTCVGIQITDRPYTEVRNNIEKNRAAQRRRASLHHRAAVADEHSYCDGT